MGGRLGVVDGVLGTHQLTSAISTSAERMGMTQLSHCCRFWRSVESSISVSAVEQEMPNYILGYGRKGCATYGRNGFGERERKDVGFNSGIWEKGVCDIWEKWASE